MSNRWMINIRCQKTQKNPLDSSAKSKKDSIHLETDRQEDRQADRYSSRQTDRKADRQKEKQTDRQTDRKTSRQTDKKSRKSKKLRNPLITSQVNEKESDNELFRNETGSRRRSRESRQSNVSKRERFRWLMTLHFRIFFLCAFAYSQINLQRKLFITTTIPFDITDSYVHIHTMSFQSRSDLFMILSISIVSFLSSLFNINMRIRKNISDYRNEVSKWNFLSEIDTNKLKNKILKSWCSIKEDFLKWTRSK